MVQSVRNKVRLAGVDPSDADDWNFLNECEKSLRWEIYDLKNRFHAEAYQLIAIAATLSQLAKRALDQFNHLSENFYEPGYESDVKAEYYYKLYSKIKGFIDIYNHAGEGVKEKFNKDETELKAEYEACSSSDITTGSWSIVNNHKLGDFDWYTFKFWGSAIAGSVQVIENNTTYDSYYSVSGSQVSLGFTLVNASGSLTMEEYVGSFKDADTIQGTWRKKGPEDKEWVEGYWTGTRNN